MTGGHNGGSAVADRTSGVPRARLSRGSFITRLNVDDIDKFCFGDFYVYISLRSD